MKTTLLSILLCCTVIFSKAQTATNNIDKITKTYIGVKNALVSSNAALAKNRSAELTLALAAPIKGLQPAQQKTFAAYIDKLKKDSKSISETSSIDSQRKSFESLSVNMFSLLSGLKLNSTTVYQQYCPMKKAGWLSESEDIRNPYYGDEMLECGTVKATLKAK